jgi:hypothetical protein
MAWRLAFAFAAAMTARASEEGTLRLCHYSGPVADPLPSVVFIGGFEFHKQDSNNYRQYN